MNHINSDLSFFFVNRRTELETKLAQENCSEEKKKRQLQSLGRKESQYLRLRRTRLGLDDFITVKVIGKGAFGEVRLLLSVHGCVYTYNARKGAFGSGRRYRQNLCNENA